MSSSPFSNPSNIPNKPVGWEGIVAPAWQEQRPGQEGRAEKGACQFSRLLKQERRLGSLRPFHGFGLDLRDGLFRCPRLLLGCELLFDLESNSVGVYLYRQRRHREAPLRDCA